MLNFNTIAIEEDYIMNIVDIGNFFFLAGMYITDVRKKKIGACPVAREQ